MRIVRTFKTAVRALRRNVMRAVLTTLGHHHRHRRGHRDDGDRPGLVDRDAEDRREHGRQQHDDLPGPGVQRRGQLRRRARASSLTPDDAEAIRRECPAVKAVAPVERERAHGELQRQELLVADASTARRRSSSTSATGRWRTASISPTSTSAAPSRSACSARPSPSELFGDESPDRQGGPPQQRLAARCSACSSRKGANMMGSTRTTSSSPRGRPSSAASTSPDSSGSGAGSGGASVGVVRARARSTRCPAKYPAGKVQLYPEQLAVAAGEHADAGAVHQHRPDHRRRRLRPTTSTAAVEQITARAPRAARPAARAARRLHHPQHDRVRRHARRTPAA